MKVDDYHNNSKFTTIF